MNIGYKPISDAERVMFRAREYARSHDFEKAAYCFGAAIHLASDTLELELAKIGAVASISAIDMLASMPDHPHRGQAASTEFEAVYNRLTGELPDRYFQ